jgi:catechol 1,2-dioxygenase
MATVADSTANGTNGTNGSPRFDPNFTQSVIDSMGPKTSPRMREVMQSLIPHLHDFAREVELTVDEWMEGVQLLNWAGQMSTDKRNEGQLVCDVVGLESLVDEITYKKASEAHDLTTQSAILGPFFRTDHPVREKGASIHLTRAADAEDVYMYGRVMDAKTGKPLKGATVDVWMASTNGTYHIYHSKACCTQRD